MELMSPQSIYSLFDVSLPNEPQPSFHSQNHLEFESSTKN
jgi:hypothetical protein